MMQIERARRRRGQFDPPSSPPQHPQSPHLLPSSPTSSFDEDESTIDYNSTPNFGSPLESPKMPPRKKSATADAQPTRASTRVTRAKAPKEELAPQTTQNGRKGSSASAAASASASAASDVRSSPPAASRAATRKNAKAARAISPAVAVPREKKPTARSTRKKAIATAAEPESATPDDDAGIKVNDADVDSAAASQVQDELADAAVNGLVSHEPEIMEDPDADRVGEVVDADAPASQGEIASEADLIVDENDEELQGEVEDDEESEESDYGEFDIRPRDYGTDQEDVELQEDANTQDLDSDNEHAAAGSSQGQSNTPLPGDDEEPENEGPKIIEKPRRGRPPTKSIRGGKGTSVTKPHINRTNSTNLVTIKKMRGAPGKRKIARDWKLQAYYDRQATLKSSFKALAKLVHQANLVMANKALEKLINSDPNHHKDQPEYQKVEKELQKKFDKRKSIVQEKYAMDERLLQTRRYNDAKYQELLYKSSLSDAVDTATLKTKLGVINVIKGNFGVNDPTDAITDAGDELVQVKILPPPSMPSAPVHPSAGYAKVDARAKGKDTSPRKQPHQQAPTSSVRDDGAYRPSAMAIPMLVNNDDDDAQTSRTHKGSIMGDGPVTAPAAELGLFKPVIDGASFRSMTSTPAMADPADSTAATPEPQNAAGIPAEGELIFPNKVRGKGREAAPNNRIVGLPWFQFEEHEIGFRSMDHEGKLAPIDKTDEKRYIKSIRPVNQKTWHFNGESNSGEKIGNYNEEDFDQELIKKFRLHPKTGIPVTGSVNPDYWGPDGDKSFAPTDYANLPTPRPVTWRSHDGRQEFATSRSSNFLIIEKRFAALTANVRLQRALGAAGYLDLSTKGFATYDGIARDLQLSRDVIDKLLEGAMALENNPNLAKEIEEIDRKIEKETRDAQAAVQRLEDDLGKDKDIYDASPPRPAKAMTASSASAPQPPSDNRKRGSPDEDNSSVRSKRHKNNDSTASITDMMGPPPTPPRQGQYIWGVVAAGAEAASGRGIFPPLDPIPRGNPHALTALADVATSLDLSQIRDFGSMEPARQSPAPNRRAFSNPNIGANNFIQYSGPPQQQQQVHQPMQYQPPPRTLYPAPQQMAPHGMAHASMIQNQHSMGHPQLMPSPFGDPRRPSMGPPPPQTHQSPYQSPHHPAQSQPPPPPQYSPPTQAPRGIKPGSALRDIRPRPESHYYANAAPLPPAPYNPHYHQPPPPPPPPQYPPQYPPGHPGYGRGGRGQ